MQQIPGGEKRRRSLLHATVQRNEEKVLKPLLSLLTDLTESSQGGSRGGSSGGAVVKEKHVSETKGAYAMT